MHYIATILLFLFLLLLCSVPFLYHSLRTLKYWCSSWIHDRVLQFSWINVCSSNPKNKVFVIIFIVVWCYQFVPSWIMNENDITGMQVVIVVCVLVHGSFLYYKHQRNIILSIEVGVPQSQILIWLMIIYICIMNVRETFLDESSIFESSLKDSKSILQP